MCTFRLDVVQGGRSNDFYRHVARWGLGIGGGVTAAGLVARVVTDWSAVFTTIGHMPTDIDSIPMVVCLVAALVLFDRQAGTDSASPHLEKVRDVGRMALTNYLSQRSWGLPCSPGWPPTSISAAP